MTDLPPWIGKARAVRAVLLAALLAVIALLIHARLTLTGGGPLRAMLPLLFLIVLGLALWVDWLWLKRNHHRVNPWGLNRGKEYRKKPK
jgi:hypothetical protein